MAGYLDRYGADPARYGPAQPPAGEGERDGRPPGHHHHPRLRRPRAGGDQRPRALHLDHAHPADVHRRERLEVTERGRVDAGLPAGIQNGRSLGNTHGVAVDGELDQASGRRERDGGHRTPPSANTSSRPSAESVAAAAVCPSPQIEASRMAAAISPSSRTSSWRVPSVFPERSRCSASSCRTVPTRHGTHWPHDSSRKNLAIRRSTASRSAVSSNAITTPDPRVAPAARVASNVSGRSRDSGPTNEPAAPPSRTARSLRPWPTPPASRRTSPSVAPNSTS